MTTLRRFVWRRLTPEQDAAIAKLLAGGMSAVQLASLYHVDKRTIYRAAQRAGEVTQVVTLTSGGTSWHAHFAVADDGPVQVSAWRPVP